jgi:hypothetical protein
MSRAARAEKQHQQLIAIENEFRQLLIGALKECTDGGDGVFLLSERAEELHLARFVWPVTKELETLGGRIYELRSLLGMPLAESIYSVFLNYCKSDGTPNALGGMKRAAKLLKEIEIAGERAPALHN